MRCKSCQHILWNQPAPGEGQPRVCSECGTLYALGEFSFQPGKVKFCCRHCATAYYGTSPEGHLEPYAFTCAVCANPITMEECSVSPHDPNDDAKAMLHEPLPWLESGPMFSRWRRTVWAGIRQPTTIEKRLAAQPDPVRAFQFLALHVWISGVSAVFLGLLSMLGVSGFLMMGGGGISLAAASLIYPLAQFLCAPLFTGFVAVSASWMVSLKRTRTELTFPRAFEIVCYSSGALVYGVVPWCGAIIGYIFWAVHASQAVSEASAKGRATAAVGPLLIGGFLALVVQGVAFALIAILFGM